MKILYIENMIIGHHVPYLQALSESDKYESVIITPEVVDSIKAKQIVYPKMNFHSKKIKDYKQCFRFIEKVAKEEQVDIIHFVDGDKIMRYFGLEMNKLSKKWNVVITYHHLFEGLARKLSYICMSKKRTAVVHTTEFQKVMKQYGIEKVEHVEYPSFLDTTKITKDSDAVPVIGMFGGTRHDKGLDILLAALHLVKNPFQLIIAGREADFTRSDIEAMSKGMEQNVKMDLRFLTEEELSAYWNMTDLVVLPYRAIFDGASGQLTEGVNRGLPIIGPSHGSLADIIVSNHLGVVFQTENVEDLAKKIDGMLGQKFVYDDVAKAYQKHMSPERFCDDYFRIYTNLNKPRM